MSNIRFTVSRLIEKFNLDNPPVDPEFIAEKIGEDDHLAVNYYKFNGGVASKIRGWYDHEAKEIAVNVDDPAEEQLFTIAHELGHYLLHQEYAAGRNYIPRMDNTTDNAYEKEADEFAVRLLVPEKAFLNLEPMFSEDELTQFFIVTNDVLSRARGMYA